MEANEMEPGARNEGREALDIWAIGKVSKRPWDVNQASRGLNMMGDRLREWLSWLLYTFCAQDSPKNDETAGFLYFALIQNRDFGSMLTLFHKSSIKTFL